MNAEEGLHENVTTEITSHIALFGRLSVSFD